MRSRTEIETLQRELAEASRLREQAESEQELAARELEEIRLELAAASAEIQAELGRGVELTERADRAEQELRAAREQAAQATEELERTAAERDELSRTVAEAETRHAAELAAAASETRPDPDMEQVLQASQERLASQTEKLIEVEERAHSAERQFADTIVRLEEVEAELRHLQMEKALHDLQTSNRTGRCCRCRSRDEDRSRRAARGSPRLHAVHQGAVARREQDALPHPGPHADHEVQEGLEGAGAADQAADRGGQAAGPHRGRPDRRRRAGARRGRPHDQAHRPGGVGQARRGGVGRGHGPRRPCGQRVADRGRGRAARGAGPGRAPARERRPHASGQGHHGSRGSPSTAAP